MWKGGDEAREGRTDLIYSQNSSVLCYVVELRVVLGRFIHSLIPKSTNFLIPAYLHSLISTFTHSLLLHSFIP